MTTSEVIQRFIWLFGVWEPHLTAFISRRLTPGDTFIDVGANIGYFTVLASRLSAPTGRVVAVEACPTFHQALTANVRANRCPNVRAVNTAVSDAPRRLTFYLERSTNLGGTTVVQPRTVESSFEADALPLPRIVTDAELTTTRLIKIDVEGAEAAAIRGLAPLLHRLRPDAELVVEVTPRLLAKQGQTVDDVLAPLHEHGLHTYRLPNDYHPASYPTALRRPAVPVRWRGPITRKAICWPPEGGRIGSSGCRWCPCHITGARSWPPRSTADEGFAAGSRRWNSGFVGSRASSNAAPGATPDQSGVLGQTHEDPQPQQAS